MSQTGKRSTKFVFVTGGVLSGVGKGISAASIGNSLKHRGLSINIQKCDPYLNVDAGTLNPAEHGEVFVTKDGAETDLDLGHYERFLDEELTRESSLMSGRVLRELVAAEREGQFLGKTVQVIPHLTDAIKDHIWKAAEGYDVHIVEIGGTVGDYESPAFLEAIRQIGVEVGSENAAYVHVVYLPYLGASKEFKTKPAQNAVRDLRGIGIAPDLLVARCEDMPPPEVADKLSAFCGVSHESIALLPNASTVYEVPVSLDKSGFMGALIGRLDLPAKKLEDKVWRDVVAKATDDSLPSVKVGVVAKYMNNEDSYMSVFESLKAAGWHNDVRVEIDWINSEDVEAAKDPAALLNHVDGVLVPGGFGSRGIEGKIAAATYARHRKIPYLGLCLGLQMAVIGLAREVVDENAHTTEIDEHTKHPVIDIMLDQKHVTDKGGTMRLGDYPCHLQDGSLARKLYGHDDIKERHRHRFEVNNAYREQLEAAGMKFSGLSPDGNLVEIIEIPDHPFYLASQFHPEFKSRPDRAHPMFDGFVAACKKAAKK